MTKDMKFATMAIHLGQDPDPVTGAVIPPIYQTSTYAQEAPGVHKGYVYTRVSNPTVKALETALAGLEGGKHGYSFASGLGATTVLFLALLKSGDHIILCDDVYGGTFRLLDKVLKNFGLSASYIDMTDPSDILKAIRPETKMIFFETPTNPMLKMVDIEAVAKIAQKKKLITVLDNTFATPYLQRPLEMGIDIALHSTTKYINGHSDVVGGALILKDDTYAEAIAFHQKSVGANPDPFACWLTLRGLKTLAIRMEAHCKSAQEIAEFLEKHPAVEEVIYPGLKSHPQYELAKRQMKMPGGMISIRLKGTKKETDAFLKKLKYFYLAESLGGVESLIQVPALMTHASVDKATREALGITDTLVRISLGIEDVEDLKADLAQAL